jgi:type I site-specific restriction endonuclease
MDTRTKALSERDICTQFIAPALKKAGWDFETQVREEVSFTKGRILVQGKLVSRGQVKRADYILYHKPHLPAAIIEAKNNNYSLGDGMQQALGYAEALDIPFVYSSNGDGFLEHDRTLKKGRSKAERKRAIIDELEEQGILLTAFGEEVGKHFDPFDLVCHVAFDQPALTRRERAEGVKKRNYFTKYGDKARAVLNALVDKYAERY